MQELDSYLNLGQEMHGLNDELEVEKANWTVLCVVLSVRTWCICLAL